MTGSMPCSDQAVTETLRKIVDKPNSLSDGQDAIATLFKLFLDELTDCLDVAEASVSGSLEKPANKILHALSIDERRFFLLRYVEELDLNVVTSIVGITQAEADEIERSIIRELNQLQV